MPDIVQCYVVEKQHAPQLIMGARARDHIAATLYHLFYKWMDGESFRKTRQSCLNCQYDFFAPMEPEAFCFALRPGHGETPVLMWGICERCYRRAGDNDGLTQLCIERMRKVFPGAEVR